MPSPAARVDPTKSETVLEIRDRVARLSPVSLRRVREDLFRLELRLVGDMIESGVDIPRATAISHVCRTIDAIDQLQAGARERLQRR